LITLSVESSECPVSLLSKSPELRSLVLLDAKNRQAQRATGATMFGPDSGRWPAVWFDAVSALQSARDEEEAARIEAINQKHGN
jgi:hypothetical protein